LRDRLAVALFTPLWLVCFGATLLSIGDRVALVPFYVDPAEGPQAYPVIRGLAPWMRFAAQPDPSPRPGDRLLSLGGVDLAGAGRQRVASLAWAHTRRQGRLELELERAGAPLAAAVQLPPSDAKWPALPVSLGFAAAALGGLLLAPRHRLLQVAFPAFLSTAFWMAGYFGRTPSELLAAFWVRIAAFTAMTPLYVRVMRFFPSGDEQARWARGWPVLLGLNGVLIADTELFGILPGEASRAATHVCIAVGALLALAIGTRGYRASGPRGRRQFRWLLLGTYVAYLPALAAVTLAAIGVNAGPTWVLSQLATLAVPIAGGIGLFRGDLFDVDRILTTTVTFTLLGCAAIIALGAGVPLGAEALAARGLLEERSASLLFTVILLVLLAGAGLALQRFLQRIVSRGQLALESDVSALLARLSGCGKLAEIVALLGDRLPLLFGSEGAAVWAGEPGRLVRVHASGPEAPAEWRDLGPGGFLLPIERRGERVALVALGAKRNADLYTAHERALLGTIASRAGGVLERLEMAALLAGARRLAEGLAREKERLGRASEAKSTLLATASHDVRQPLHALSLLLGALDERVRDPEARALLERVQGSAQSLGQMLDGLLDAAKLDAGVLEPRIEEVALGPLLARLAQEAEPIAKASGLELRVRETDLRLQSDPLLLRSILQNLIGNALRHTRQGGVLVGARRRGGEVEIQVWDTGPGFPEQEGERLFQAWERGTAAETSGLGLGLSLVRRLAQLLGHRVMVRSRPGRGSLFAVVGRQPPVRRTTAAIPETVIPAAGPASSTVAVIDDEPQVLAAMLVLLRTWGFRVLGAASARELIDQAEGSAATPDVLVVDLRLQHGASGLDAIASVSAALGGPFPALVISADTSAEARAQVQASGHLLLAKPVEPVRLRAALAHLLGSH
jgi:signal transduction histidine kinase/CheY-like chemotaxis protein